MKVNVKKLDETIAKLQELRRLATDPALSSFVVVTGRNTNGSSPHSESQAYGNGNGHSALKASVLAACKAITGDFTIRQVSETMKSQGHEFTSDTAEKSVGNVLRALVSENAITVAVQGKGRRATEYRNV
jgi:hypothetical protein